MARPIFSGHESFACKSHWLKRGYDFVIADRNFNDDDAVVHLGVGKNMVASIRFWLKAVGLLQDNELNPIADYLFNDENGQDPIPKKGFILAPTPIWNSNRYKMKKELGQMRIFP